MYDLRPVAIGQRGSLFAAGVNDPFGHALGSSLGQAGQSIYQNAKDQVKRFDSLVERTKKIAVKQVREQIADEFGLGEPGNKDKARYMREATAYDIGQAESFTPVNYYVFEAPGPAKHRPGNLQGFNNDFQKRVEQAESTYGILPEPQVIEKIVEVPGATAPAASPIVPIVVVGGLAVAGIMLFSALR